MGKIEDVLCTMAFGFAYLVAGMGSIIILAVIIAAIEFAAGEWAMTLASIIFIFAFAYIAGHEILKR